MKLSLLSGDCLERLRAMASDQVDSLVTDPPAGISFMGKEWDHHKGGRKEWVAWMTSVMSECMRVMKPGAHGLVWALPRTSHWTATALEDAGFEVRDVITHLFGTGFPKSLDVSKAIDKAAGAERTVVGHQNYSAPDIRGNSYDQGHVSDRERLGVAITAPATDAAKQWQGWGTALKPASEHWILIRKPCSEKTVAANVLKWGTGAINVDASRVGISPDDPNHRPGTTETVADTNSIFGVGGQRRGSLGAGRFPANLTLDEYAAGLLDEQSGTLKTGNGPTKRAGIGYQGGAGNFNETPRAANEGGASRFFYVAKASKADKNAGLEGMEKRKNGMMEDDNYPIKTGSGNLRDTRNENFHPTVKSTALMTYLIRMVTPPGGTVLDPFMGSGSTGVAARGLKLHFIGIEQDPDYLKIASARINKA